MLSAEDLGLGSVDIFYLSDFDPTGTGTPPVLFGFTIRSTGDEVLELFLVFEVFAPDGILLRGESAPFLLAPLELKSGSNHELSDFGSEFRLSSFDISAAGEDLQQTVLETGFLPEGDYEFRLAINGAEDGAELSYCILTLHTSNPRIVIPIYPGAPFAESLPVEAATLPQFQWESEAAHFNLRLCPVLSGDSSGEEVMENEPVYENLDFETGFAGMHNFFYPSSAEELQIGSSYCWQVEAVVAGSGGDFIYPGEIFCFEIASGSFLEAYDELLQALLLLLPPGSLDAVLGELQGFRATGAVAVDGLEFPGAELPLLLESLLNEGWDLGTVEVEP